MVRDGKALGLVKGTLDLLVMKALSWGPMHGYGITVWLEERSGGSLAVEDSALYQSLHRLESRRLVRAEWGMTENNRRARYYRLTSKGRRHFETQSEAWERYTRSVSNIMTLESPSG